MRSRRNLFGALGALPLALLLSSPAVAAGPPTLAVGSFSQVSFIPSNERVVGTAFQFDFTEVDALTGDLAGTSVLQGSCVVHAPGTGTWTALESFTGTVDGRAGAAQFWNVFDVDALTGSFPARFTALGGTGEPREPRGTGPFEGIGTTGTYAARITFAP
jgi:hypothetical protein